MNDLGTAVVQGLLDVSVVMLISSMHAALRRANCCSVERYMKSLDMDFSLLLNQLISMSWYLVPCFILVTIIKTRWFKGVLGEFQVNLLLKLFLPKENYHLIKNVTLPTEDGTTQIDHILVSKYGVFVIETKNMKGWIFASFNQKHWTQKIFKHTNKFQNPIHQNFKHIKTLESCLSIKPEFLYTVIVFIGDSTFKTKMPEYVTYATGCVRYIKSKKVEVLTQQEIVKIVGDIEGGRLQRGIKTNLDHVAHIKKVVNVKEKEKPKNACPKCGSKMVLRKFKKGANADNQFWGCSVFPKCRAVVNVA